LDWKAFYRMLIANRVHDTYCARVRSFLWRAYTYGRRGEVPVFLYHLLARVDGELAGIACVGDNGKGQPYVNLYVRPRFRRQGLGEALLSKVIAACPDVCAFPTPTSRALYVKHRLELISLKQASRALKGIQFRAEMRGRPDYF
jgi:GNAT superfamily N-acetyltransferase